MSHTFKKTLLASAVAISAATAVAADPPSAAAISDSALGQAEQVLNAAQSSEQITDAHGTASDSHSSGSEDAGAMESAEGNTQSGNQATTSQTSAELHPGLSAKRADEIDGMAVSNQTGDEIGKVDKVVREATTQQLYVIVSVGGVLGMGDKLIPMPLSQLQLKDDALIAPTSKNEDSIEQDRTAYVEENYREINDEGRTLGELGAAEFSAFEKQSDY